MTLNQIKDIMLTIKISNNFLLFWSSKKYFKHIAKSMQAVFKWLDNI